MGESLGTSWSKTLMKDEKEEERLLYYVYTTIQKKVGILGRIQAEYNDLQIL